MPWTDVMEKYGKGQLGKKGTKVKAKKMMRDNTKSKKKKMQKIKGSMETGMLGS
jgi:hypothetical protein